jgi:hypothetical protein
LNLTEKNPNYKEKRKFLSTEIFTEKKFKIQENLLENQVVEFFSYLRFILYDGDIGHIYKVFMLKIRLFQILRRIHLMIHHKVFT